MPKKEGQIKGQKDFTMSKNRSWS